jgi:hypothetical protein
MKKKASKTENKRKATRKTTLNKGELRDLELMDGAKKVKGGARMKRKRD